MELNGWAAAGGWGCASQQGALRAASYQQFDGQDDVEIKELSARVLRVLLGAESVLLLPQLRALVLGGARAEGGNRR